jgi:hypothetical protein
MYLLENLAEFNLPVETLKAFSRQFMTIFYKALQDKEVKVKVAGLKATSKFLSSIEDQDLVVENSGIIEPILETVVLALKTDEEQGKQSLQSLVDLTVYHSEVWNKFIPSLLSVTVEIMKAKSFDDATRSNAVEMVLTIAENQAAALRKEDKMNDFIYALMLMMTEIEFPTEEETEDWANEIDEDELTKNDVHTIAKQAIARLSSALGEKTTMKLTGDLIQKAIMDPDFKTKIAGYNFMGLICEPCNKVMTTNINDAVITSCKGIADDNTRVRYAGLTCFALLVTEVSPLVQKKYHGEVFPKIIEMMRSEKYLKMKTHATSAMLNLVAGLIQEDEDEIEETVNSSSILDNYLTDLLSVSASLLEESITQNYAPLQQEVLSLLSNIAIAIETKFGDYYTTFVPALKSILATVPSETLKQQELRSKCIETMGYMVAAVSERREEFQADVTEIITGLMNGLSSLKEEDSQHSSINKVIPQFSSLLKEDFKPFLPNIMTNLFEGAKANCDFKLQDAELPIEEINPNYSQTVLEMGGQKLHVSMNTSALEKKKSSCESILALAENLGTSFFDYVEPTTELMVELMSFKFNKDIRKSVLRTFQYLVAACGEEEKMKKLFQVVYPHFKKNILDELKKNNIGMAKTFLKELTHCTKDFKTVEFMPEGEMENLAEIMVKSVENAREAKFAAMKDFKKSKLAKDEEDFEEFKEQLEKFDKTEMCKLNLLNL